MREAILQRPLVLLARTLAYIDVLSLNPGGKVFFPALVRSLVEKYGFLKFPQTLEEMDLAKGIEFLAGKAGNQPIQKFAIWNSLVTVETVSGTDESKMVIDQILDWGKQNFGLLYTPDSVKRFAYISDIAFSSDAPILQLNPATEALTKALEEAMADIWKEPFTYQPLGLKIGHDPVSRPFNIAPFSIERKGDANFSENRYFSEAPLPTQLHLKLLEDFENMCHAKTARNV